MAAESPKCEEKCEGGLVAYSPTPRFRGGTPTFAEASVGTPTFAEASVGKPIFAEVSMGKSGK